MARVPPGMQVEIDRLGFSFPNDDELEVEGPNAWSAAKDRWNGGTLRRVRLRGKDKHGRGFRILLETPHRIEIPELMTYPDARELLVALRLVSGGAPAEAPWSRATPLAKKGARKKAGSARGRRTVH